MLVGKLLSESPKKKKVTYEEAKQFADSSGMQFIETFSLKEKIKFTDKEFFESFLMKIADKKTLNFTKISEFKNKKTEREKDSSCLIA